MFWIMNMALSEYLMALHPVYYTTLEGAIAVVFLRKLLLVVYSPRNANVKRILDLIARLRTSLRLSARSVDW